MACKIGLNRKEQRRFGIIDTLTLKNNDKFIATDRIGRTSTWKMVEQKDETHFLLEAIGETMRNFEKAYLLEKKTQGKRGRKGVDFGRIEVCNVWFEYREIELINEE